MAAQTAFGSVGDILSGGGTMPDELDCVEFAMVGDMRLNGAPPADWPYDWPVGYDSTGDAAKNLDGEAGGIIEAPAVKEAVENRDD